MVGSTPRDLVGDAAQVSFPDSSRPQVSDWGPHSKTKVFTPVQSRNEEGSVNWQ